MTAPYVPMKRSILDRLSERLFPTLGLMDPQEGQAVGRQGLLQLGANLLQAGGASPQQGGTLANIGRSIAGVDVDALQKHAMALQAYRQQQSAQRRVAEVAGANAPKEGETPAQTYERIARMVGQLAGTPGTEDLIGKLSNVLAQIKPERAAQARYSWETVIENGVPMRYRVNVDDPSDRFPIGVAQSTTQLPQADERRAAGLQIVGRNAWATLQRHFKAPSWGDFAAGKIPFGIGQAFTSKDYQSMIRSGRDFGRSYLYMVSGANAPVSEVEGWATDNLPQPGDSPQVIQEKLEALRVKGEAMEAWVGRAGGKGGGAGGPPPPPPPAAGGINPRFDPRQKR